MFGPELKADIAKGLRGQASLPVPSSAEALQPSAKQSEADWLRRQQRSLWPSVWVNSTLSVMWTIGS